MTQNLSREEVAIVRRGAYCLKWAAGCWVGSVVFSVAVSTLFRSVGFFRYLYTASWLVWVAGGLLWVAGRVAMLRLQDRTSVLVSWAGLLADLTFAFAVGGALGHAPSVATVSMVAVLVSFLCMQECLARLSRKLGERSLLRRARRIQAITLGYGLVVALAALFSSYFLMMVMPVVLLVIVVATCTQFLLTSKALDRICSDGAS